MAVDVSLQAGLIEQFKDKAAAVGTTVEHVGGVAEAAELIRTWAAEADTAEVVVSPQLSDVAPELMAAMANVGLSMTAVKAVEDARDKPLGLSLAHQAVAETGSVLLGERTVTDRAASLMTLHNVIIVRIADLVPSLDDTAAILREMSTRAVGGYASFVTGPSRTADIEMSLTVGVQGPAQSTVLFVDELM
jgi:L-lactate dehydrogenase complex protein LldG